MIESFFKLNKAYAHLTRDSQKSSWSFFVNILSGATNNEWRACKYDRFKFQTIIIQNQNVSGSF